MGVHCITHVPITHYTHIIHEHIYRHTDTHTHIHSYIGGDDKVQVVLHQVWENSKVSTHTYVCT